MTDWNHPSTISEKDPKNRPRILLIEWRDGFRQLDLILGEFYQVTRWRTIRSDTQERGVLIGWAFVSVNDKIPWAEELIHQRIQEMKRSGHIPWRA